MTDSEIVWEGSPYPHIFVRPDHVLSFGAMLIFGLGCAAYLIVNGIVWFAIVVVLFSFASVSFSLLYDRNLRLRLRYRLDREGLTIYDHASQGIVRFIPAAHLSDASLTWRGAIASIDLPFASPRLDLFDSWRNAIPTLDAGARLELVRNPRNVLANLHSVANLTGDCGQPSDLSTSQVRGL
jgi:hypothetical protein